MCPHPTFVFLQGLSVVDAEDEEAILLLRNAPALEASQWHGSTGSPVVAFLTADFPYKS